MAQKNSNNKKVEKKGKNGRAAKPSVPTRIKNYLLDVKAEMKRVVWPTKKELLNASLIVVGVFVAIIDNIVLIPLEALASLGQ